MDFCNRISVCLLTFNSSRLLRDVLQPVAAFADEIIVWIRAVLTARWPFATTSISSLFITRLKPMAGK